MIDTHEPRSGADGAAYGIAPGRDPARRDQEDVRLVTGFADIFAAVVLIGGLVALIGVAGAFIGAGSGVVAAVALWFLPVPLVERRHFAACAIVLAGAFAVCLAIPSFALLKSFGAIPVAIGLYFHWQRYRIPLSAALGIAALVAFPVLFLVNITEIANWDQLPSGAAIFVGAVLFGIAMWWDLSDRERLTRRSDVAFWLHLMAGPLLVHGLFSLLGIGRYDGAQLQVWPVIALFALFTITALVIDRRPLLIASFGYFLFALGALAYRQMAPGTGFAAQAVSVPQAFMIATLSGGLLVAILAAGWSPLRRLVLGLLPSAIADRVPPPSHWTPPTRTAMPADPDRANAPGESEPFRLVLGLNDYLATLGLNVLFLGGLAAGYVIVSRMARGLQVDMGGRSIAEFSTSMAPWMGLIVPFVILLVAGEIFVRRQRMALTAVAASTLMALVTMIGAALYLWQVEGAARAMAEISQPGAMDRPIAVASLVIAFGLAAFINWGFGLLNRIPASAAWGAVLLIPLIFTDLLVTVPQQIQERTDLSWNSAELRLILYGVLIFAVALFLDWRDPARRTQRADIAFWLHLLASLLVVITLFRWAASSDVPTLATLGLYAALVVLALVINRRAPLVVGIPFVLTAIDLPDGTTQLFVQLIFFAALMALVLKWEWLRGQLLARVGRAPA